MGGIINDSIYRPPVDAAFAFVPFYNDSGLLHYNTQSKSIFQLQTKLRNEEQLIIRNTLHSLFV